MHWHAHAVNALAFNSDGTYLLSGGDEAVLVVWQLSTGDRRYFPRLGVYLNNSHNRYYSFLVIPYLYS